MSDKHHINDNELNQTLREFFLDKNADSANEALAEFVMNVDYNVKIDRTKERAILDKLQDKKGFGGYGLFLSLLVLMISFFALLSYFSAAENNFVAVSKKNNTAGPNKKMELNGSEEIIDRRGTSNGLPITTSYKDTFGKIIVDAPFLQLDSPKVKESVIRVQKETRLTPFLTDEDRIRYKKIKELMLQKLYKSDKALYTHMDADKIDYNGNEVILDAFSMRNMGITNLEYKTFLADLLVQNKHEDYITAQVIPAVWGVYGYTELADTYYRDEKYNDFPVVNITINGAELFCRWLEEEVKVYMKQNNLKEKPLSVRLPYDTEWLYAARNGFAKIAFEGGYNTIFDVSEGFIDKATLKRLGLVRKRVKKQDSLFYLVSANHYGWNEKDIIDLFAKGLKYYNTNPTDTIHSERMKIFGKAGHVSELIKEKRSGKIWFIGTSWKNKEDYVKLQSEYKNTMASPFVGFRPVIINKSDPEYKNPFW